MSETRDILIRLAGQHDINGLRFVAFLDLLDRNLDEADATNVQEALRAVLAPAYVPVFVTAPEPAEVAGDETISGVTGNDTVQGAEGNDTILGGQGDDSVSGGGPVDTLGGGQAADSVDAASGNDTVVEPKPATDAETAAAAAKAAK